LSWEAFPAAVESTHPYWVTSASIIAGVIGVFGPFGFLGLTTGLGLGFGVSLGVSPETGLGSGLGIKVGIELGIELGIGLGIGSTFPFGKFGCSSSGGIGVSLPLGISGFSSRFKSNWGLEFDFEKPLSGLQLVNPRVQTIKTALTEKLRRIGFIR
jgi:hypothetical protein